MTTKILGPHYLNSISNELQLNIPKDSYTADKDLKFKLRSINLVKYNPNLFTNKDTGFLEIMGGEKSAYLIIGTGLVFALYRNRLNMLRHSSIRHGIWMTNIYFIYGCAVGAFYSACFFWRWQMHFNDINAHWLIKRYNSSSELHRADIYKFKDIPNTDECYNFSNKYWNHAHI